MAAEIDVEIAAFLVARVSGRIAAENCAIGGITASALTLRQPHRCGALTPSQRGRSLVHSRRWIARAEP
jgi:hypothetical protein